MKLPKGFGGQGFQGALAQAQQAMAQAQSLETELEAQTIEVDKGPVKALFNGVGELKRIMIVDRSIVDPNDVEALEDLIVGAVRDGFVQAKELREAKTRALLEKSGLPF